MLDNVTNLRGTIIVKKIIPVLTVLWLTVPHQIGIKGICLLGGKVQHLFRDGGTTFFVFASKILPGDGNHHIIAFSTNETPNEVRLTKGKNAIVENHILAFGEIAATKCRMAIQRIYFPPRRTRNETGLDAVSLLRMGY